MRAGIAALLTNMLLNFAFLALLYQLMVPDALKAQGILAALGQQPGLHLALGIASALSSYLNLGLLWYWLSRSNIYTHSPGWRPYMLRLTLACAAMAAVLLALMHWRTDFLTMDRWQKMGWLAILVSAGEGPTW